MAGKKPSEPDAQWLHGQTPGSEAQQMSLVKKLWPWSCFRCCFVLWDLGEPSDCRHQTVGSAATQTEKFEWLWNLWAGFHSHPVISPLRRQQQQKTTWTDNVSSTSGPLSTIINMFCPLKSADIHYFHKYIFEVSIYSSSHFWSWKPKNKIAQSACCVHHSAVWSDIWCRGMSAWPLDFKPL